MIWLVRHGEAAAAWGEAADPGLSELGLKQASATADMLRNHAFDQILTSPMTRCQQTAAPLAAAVGQPAMIDATVTEIPTPENLDDRRAWLSSFMAGNWKDAHPITQDWRKALVRKVRSINTPTIIFTHFVAINTVVGALSKSDKVTSFRPGHCSATKLQGFGGDLRVETYGDEAATRVL